MSSPNSSLPDFDSDVGQSGGASPVPGTSTAPSSPPTEDRASSEAAGSTWDTEYESTREEDIEDTKPVGIVTMNETETERRLSRLQFVLERSAVYSSILQTRMDEEKAKQRALCQEKQKNAQLGRKRGRSDLNGSPKGKRKKGLNGEAVVVADLEEDGEDEDEGTVFQQPALVTGAKLKPYQLEGLQWMVSLDQNGISGILADEMGLGKTLQTIAFSAYLREHNNSRPFLVVCPLSVLHNWVDEYAKFAPEIPVCMYHGSPAERAELRRTVMARPGAKAKADKKKAARKSTKPPKAKKAPAKSKSKARKSETHAEVPLRRSGRPRKSTVIIESDEGEVEDLYQPEDVDKQETHVMDVDEAEAQEFTSSFPIVLTTYEMIIRDRVHLAHYDWGYIVVDEGHRLKNLDCKLMQEIKKYTSAGRMILTGTPLHNNLAELWSLLNFILPDIFDDIDTFQQWFNLPELQSALPTTQSTQIISSLHAILKPFLLRRLKVDVETNMPPKKEYVLYAPLSIRQRDAYDRVLNGGLRKWLIQGGTGGMEVVGDDVVEGEGRNEDDHEEVKLEEIQDDEQEEDAKRRVSRRSKKSGRKSYAVDGDDEEYFEMLERGDVNERGLKVIKTQEEEEAEEARIGREHQARTKVKQVNNMKLQNTVMQLRKVCSHPFLFDWPIDPETRYPVLGEELLNASGKMMVLDRLLRELFKRGHKVLLFSQFTTMLDIIEEWAVDYMGWPICRIDGKTAPLDRREEMNKFQTGSGPNAPCLFLLSTRAGGLGINLVAADTVIFYDQDWNPQMDAQAQDRAHRIGQTRPVLIFRLVSAHTIETKIMERATEKRKLEALVIAKGKFKMPAAAASTKRETMAEMAASLLRLESEKIEVVPNTKEGKQGVISDADLDALLDRRPEVFAERGKGWTSSGAAAGNAQSDKSTDEKVELIHAAGSGKKAAFAVYEAPVEESSDALAKMLGEEEAE
ncbi:SNF2 family N-terminal domain-containing protein [Crassisporium funariophilum]|nr:SNF2 family N-terminal domain-containing protein [Crassisporium funariophilum]